MAVGLGFLLFLPLAVYQVRLATYAELVLILPYAALLARVLDALDASPAGGAAIVTQVPSATGTAWSLARGRVVVAFATGFWILGLAIFLLIPHQAAESRPNCALAAMATYLGEAFGGVPRRILSFGLFGAEILYRTPHEVIGTGLHRNAAGMVDTYDIFNATDDTAARAIVERRGIDLILICPSARDVVGNLPENGGRTFYRRLEKGVLPGGLKSVSLPAYLEAFRLVEVTEQNLGGAAPPPGSPWKRGKRSHPPPAT